MAKINNIQIKNLKSFKDHEGAGIYQGDIWYKGKKLGEWSQDSWGGPDNYHFSEAVLNNEVKAYKESDRVKDEDRGIYDLDILLSELIHLMLDEKEYKKAIKKGYKAYIVAGDGYHKMAYYDPHDDKQKIQESDYYKGFERKCRDKFFKNWDGDVRIYTSKDDFNIAV